MPLLQIMLVIIVVGVILWLVEAFLPMPANIKRLLEIVVIIVLVIWLLQISGLLGYLPNPRIGRM
jgi:hypothetical protein